MVAGAACGGGCGVWLRVRRVVAGALVVAGAVRGGGCECWRTFSWRLILALASVVGSGRTFAVTAGRCCRRRCCRGRRVRRPQVGVALREALEGLVAQLAQPHLNLHRGGSTGAQGGAQGHRGVHRGGSTGGQHRGTGGAG